MSIASQAIENSLRSPRVQPYRRKTEQPRHHSVQFYQDDSFLLDGLGRLVGAALGAGDSAVVVATEEHRHALDARLKTRGLDLNVAAREGRYLALDAADTLARIMIGRSPDADSFFEVIGGVIAAAAAASYGESRRVTAFGEMVALLWAGANRDAALELEDLWNRLGQREAFSLHCAYPLSFFKETTDAQSIAQVCSRHSTVVPAESYSTLSSDEERLRLIVDLQQKAQALEREIERRKDFDRQKESFLSAAAHDLKSPLTSIQGLVQMLDRRLSRSDVDRREEVKDTLDSIQSGTRKMAGLIDELLDVSRLETVGSLALNCQAVDLIGLARDVLVEQQLTTSRHKLELSSSVETLVGWWDRGRLERALTNVVSNAIKFSPAGGEIQVGLAADQLDTPKWAKITVTDHGIGIPRSDIGRIFERFERAANVAHLLPGNGIGLSYVQEIVLQHDGTVEVESQEGAGTAVIIRLPLRPPE